MSEYTQRQLDAVIALREACKKDGRPVTPARFALFFWPGKTFARSNGPWGLGPDASGRHGGRMLTRLYRMGLVRLDDHDGYYTASLSDAGIRVADLATPKEGTP